jgi:uncharacterized protein
MHFEGEFRVPGASDDVMRRFADVPRMARCMPGAVLEPQAEDGSWPGAMVVAFGPKRINFKGRVTCDFDTAAKTGALQGRGTADMRAARIGVKVAFALHDDPAAAEPTTIVTIKSDAELGGVLADFARTGGIAVANVVMQDFARRATEEFAKDAPPPAIAATPPDGAPVASPASAGVVASPTSAAANAALPSGTQDAAPPTALAAHGVLWAVIKFKLHQLAQFLGLAAKDAS